MRMRLISKLMLMKILSPMLFFAAILTLELYRTKTGIFYTVAPLFPTIVLLSVFNGPIGGFIGATVVSVYVLQITPDFVRALTVTVSCFVTVAMISYLNQIRKEIDTVEKLIHRMWVMHSLLLANLVKWPDMDDEEKWRTVESINEEVANIMTYARGWHILAQEKESLEDDEC